MTSSPQRNGLANILDALNAWLDACRVNWASLEADVVPLPEELKIEDLARVALYGTSLQDVEILCSAVRLDSPRTSCAPLILLSEMAASPHPQQRTALEQHLDPMSVYQMATQGHVQCRDFAGKLFLRVWGSQRPTEFHSLILAFLYGCSECLRDEALRCVAKVAYHQPEHLPALRNAALERGGTDLVDSLLTLLQQTDEKQVLDGAVLVLLWLFPHDAQLTRQSSSVQATLSYVIQHALNVEQNNLVLVLFHDLSNLAAANDIINLLYSSGISQLILKLLSDFQSSTLLHSTCSSFCCNETLFEVIMKVVWQLAQIPDARTQIKASAIPDLILSTVQNPIFLENANAWQFYNLYIEPLMRSI